MRWVREGHCIGVFPAGEVSSWQIRRGGVADPRWNVTAARISRITGAGILPVYFRGCNSPLFQILGLLHPRFRTVMLPRELLNKQNCRIEILIGNSISPERHNRFDSPSDLTDYLRIRTYIQKNRRTGQTENPETRRSSRTRLHPEPLIEGIPSETLRGEIESLPSDRCLLTSGPFQVFFGSRDETPEVITEIGRLREKTFRQVGEGTGDALDIDRFDSHYIHLFVWQRERHEIVGAYRAGPLDLILERYGINGLYTGTLFKFKSRLLNEMSPALEMGRSFIREEYQRHHSPLMLLWKGIGKYVVRHPRYKRLFGPVSISNEYHFFSKILLITFLQQNHLCPEFAPHVKPKSPCRFPPIREWDPRITCRMVQDLECVDELLAEIETEMHAVPVLLRQYLKLNARLLGFNIDQAFGDVLDALMLVDLTRIDRPILYKYMGKEDAETFLAYHQA